MAGFVKKCPCLRPKIEQEVRVLDYRHSSLQDVPSEVFNVERTLEELLADSNQIRDLPRELFYCHGLRKLSISDNEVTSIPPAISSLANLEELDFSKNGIIDVPDSIKACKYLRSIDASVNPLGKLPEGFTQLSNLTHLYLNDTFLDYLPGSFGRMVKLRILELRENHLKTLPRTFSRLQALERLDIGNNEFTELSDVIGGLLNLLELWCDHNQISSITHTIGNLKQLMFLDASKNQIEDLPGEIEGCVALADLHLTGNNLTSLPDSIGNLNHLTTLKVDDNRLTTLPKTLGGLSSLSELNVSTNDLEDLPASIGLLRNMRTFYADENLLRFVPAELGSCNGITVLSLRSNKLTYVPDELGRIPRLRVLNLSDNMLRYLPFSIVKLKELQALWLSENQTRPLIPLQSEYEADTGRKILTCYLLPQGEMKANDERDPTGDTESFHASMWDEERLRRQQIHFDFIDDSDEEGTLVRCPTPYPKEMREKVRHARNLAMRQMIGATDPGGGDTQDATGRSAVSVDEAQQSGFSYSKVPEQTEVRVREARITTPTSPTLHESHRLYRCDKEKLLKDKARMQHRLSVPDLESHIKEFGKEKSSGRRGNKFSEDKMSKRSGSVPDLQGLAEAGDESKPSRPPARTYEDLYYNQLVSRARGRRARRMRDYDSDTGYRSDRELIRFKTDSGEDRGSRADGASSEVLSVRSQPLPHNHRGRRRRDGGYNSDLDIYPGGTFGTANEAVEAYQKKIQQQQQQHMLGQLGQISSSNSALNGMQPSPNSTPTSSRHFRPPSPSRSEPYRRGSRPSSDYQLRSDHHSMNPVTMDTNLTASKDDLYNAHPGSKDSQHISSHYRFPSSSDRLGTDDYYPPQINDNDTPRHLHPAHQSQAISAQQPTRSQSHMSPSLQRHAPNTDPRPTQRYNGPPPAVAPKPSLRSIGEASGGSGSLSYQAPSTPSPSVFRKDNFAAQSTPLMAPNMPGVISDSPQQGSRERRTSANLYTVLEERPHIGKNPPSQKQQGDDLPASPPPYQPAPPYRRGENGTPVGLQRGERLSSESSSSRVDSPHSASHLPLAFAMEQHQHGTEPSTPNMNRSQSSPCGFHGSNPFPDLPTTPREKLSFSDYADLDRERTPNRYVGNPAGGSGHHLGGDIYRDNQTSRSGSSSSQIGSASQVGLGYRGSVGTGEAALAVAAAAVARGRDRSNSSDSKGSEFHNHSSSQDSPRPGGGSMYGRPRSRQGSNNGPHNSSSFETANYEELHMITSQEQSSQVSSSTDSGYGHGTHVYERIGDFVHRVDGYMARGGPGSHSSGATPTPPSSQRQTPVKNGQPPSRETTPSIEHIVPDSTTQEYRDVFRTTIKKNPGLGFSIAGGIGSHGNPYRPNDMGIFVTKVIPNGAAAQSLKPGDKILEANKIDFTMVDHSQAVSVLKNSTTVSLRVERIQKVNMV